tara:strand:+ start:2449 stop:2568 length:120 start_codon:yes stop_codon:yes gene_type:complete
MITKQKTLSEIIIEMDSKELIEFRDVLNRRIRVLKILRR